MINGIDISKEPLKKLHYAEIDSTQDEAKRLIKEGKISLADGEMLFVSATTQSKGRGRFGRTWVSPANKGLYFSCVKILERESIEAHSELEFAETFTKAAALLVIDAMQNFFGAQCDLSALKLKPINDVYYNEKKLAGILVEIINHEQKKFIVIGIGINLTTLDQPLENTSDGKNAQAISLAEIFAEQNLNLAFAGNELIDSIAKQFLKKNIEA